MYNINSNKVIEETVPTRNGVVVEEGDCEIAVSMAPEPS
jgi:2-methylaconitate cis-trans-isomerase PrpF